MSVGLPTDNAARKRLQLFTYLMEYFPDAFIAEAEVAIAGNEQHNPGEPLHWAREKSTDQLNTAFRHLWDHKRGIKKDTDGQYHLAKAVWRLKAELQLMIEADRAVQEAMEAQEESDEFTPRRPTVDELRAELAEERRSNREFETVPTVKYCKFCAQNSGKLTEVRDGCCTSSGIRLREREQLTYTQALDASYGNTCKI